MRLIIDVGGSKTLIVAVDSGANELARKRFPTDEDYLEFENHLKAELDELLQTTSQPLEGIALAMPGLVDYKTNKVVALGNRDWKDLDIANVLEKTYSVPVVMDNDANFGAIGEARIGAGKGFETVLYITISTGIGTGVTFNGKIDPAMAHSEAGSMHFWEDGHYVQWEKVASGKAFFEKYDLFGKDVPADSEIWPEYAKEVAIGIKELISIIQPDIVIIGGSMGEHVPKYGHFIEDFLKEIDTSVTSIPPIVAAQNFAGAVITGGIEALNDKLS